MGFSRVFTPELLHVVVQLLSRVWLFVTQWTVAGQVSLSFSISQSLLKLMSIELVMPSNHLLLCHPLLLSSIFPSIRVFSNESALHIRWSKYWSFRFSWMSIQGWVPSGLTGLISLLSKVTNSPKTLKLQTIFMILLFLRIRSPGQTHGLMLAESLLWGSNQIVFRTKQMVGGNLRMMPLHDCG